MGGVAAPQATFPAAAMRGQASQAQPLPRSPRTQTTGESHHFLPPIALQVHPPNILCEQLSQVIPLHPPLHPSINTIHDLGWLHSTCWRPQDLSRADSFIGGQGNTFAQGPPLDYYSYGPPSQSDIYTSRSPVVPTSTSFTSVGTWPESSGGNFQHAYASYQETPNVLQTAYSQLSNTSYLQPPGRSLPPQLTIQPPDAHQPHTSFESFSPHSRNALREYPQYPPELLRLGMGEGPTQYPPSPAHSDGPGRRQSIAVSSADSLTPSTPTANKMANEHTSPSSAGSAIRREKLSVKRDRDPPRNSKNQLYCDHEQCAENPPIFRRPCEWK
jgi:hypothetical protein